MEHGRDADECARLPGSVSEKTRAGRPSSAAKASTAAAFRPARIGRTPRRRLAGDQPPVYPLAP